MAAVLSADNGSTHFRSTNLRRSHSQTSFNSTKTLKSSNYPSPSVASKGSIALAGQDVDSYQEHQPSRVSSSSAPSSAPSSPRAGPIDSSELSCVSTPASTLSFSSDLEDTLDIHDSDEEEFGYPTFLPNKLFVDTNIQPDDSLEPPPSPRTGDSYSVSPADQDSDATSRPDTPTFNEHAEDDTAATIKPSRHVDYLSHDWREEDIWSSWRYIISRRAEFSNSARLENASWRTWMKSKYKLKTVSPETLNWLKDCDVTWLYGPLQCGPNSLSSDRTELSSTTLSKSHSLVNFNKKPILKKRSVSEIMLQKSLSSASLLKQATAAVQAQETRGTARPALGRANTDYTPYSLSSRRMSNENNSSVVPSTQSSGITSPYTERKHIHFNEQVEQCIAVDVKGDYEDEVETGLLCDTGSDESESGIMMRLSKGKKRMPTSKQKKKKAANADGKIIAMLPSTTLKYRQDTPEPQETAMKHSTGAYRSSLLSPSSSQETLRPARHANQFYFDEEDEEMDHYLGPHTGWGSPPFNEAGNKSDNQAAEDEPAGMRRTPSGMLMPYEEGEPSTGDGIFGRVVDTVNTARDIAHVIWNVGWRK